MKRVVLMIITALTCGMVLTGCDSELATEYNTKNELTVDPNKYDVYVAGHEASGQEYSAYYGTDYRNVAKLWNNGVGQNLTDGTRDARATSVFVSGNDVYVVGYEASGQEYIDNDCVGTQYRYVATVWKNGVAQKLTDGTNTHTYAHSVYVSGSDVYVAGSTGNCAILWKNGVADTLFSAFWGASANSVFVSDDDVYVAGHSERFSSISAGTTIGSAKLFKNGIEQNLEGRSGNANSVFVFGSDVYLAGTHTYYAAPIFWEKGVGEYLDDGYGANSVFVSGNDVFVAGSGIGKAVLWKNGIAQNLTDQMWDVSATSVFVSGSDVFVAGYECPENGANSVAMLWVNSKAQKLTNGTHGSMACSVFVVEKN